jgi:hypothetical protein
VRYAAAPGPSVRFSTKRNMRQRSSVEYSFTLRRYFSKYGPVSGFAKSFADGRVMSKPPAMSCASSYGKLAVDKNGSND